MDVKKRVGVLGARSLVGRYLLPELRSNGWQVLAFSRQASYAADARDTGISWHRPGDAIADAIPFWVSLAPVWTLPDYFEWIDGLQPRRLVAVSSTSVVTKVTSSDSAERETVRKLAFGEEQIEAWASSCAVEWIILRPTLIYGGGQDRNISQLARAIRRFGFLPLACDGRGLRQPLHARDLAVACRAALGARAASASYNLSGGEVLTYRAMAERVFKAAGRKPRFVPVPVAAGRALAPLVRLFPQFRDFNAAFIERMGVDLVFDHADAARDLDFSPGPFALGSDDLP